MEVSVGKEKSEVEGLFAVARLLSAFLRESNKAFLKGQHVTRRDVDSVRERVDRLKRQYPDLPAEAVAQLEQAVQDLEDVLKS